jgi:anti-sigma B factor antagonist
MFIAAVLRIRSHTVGSRAELTGMSGCMNEAIPQVDTTVVGQDLVVRVAGEIAYPYTDVVHRVCELREPDGLRRVVLDLSDTTFIDSAGIAALTACHRYAQTARLDFAIRNAPPVIRREIEMTGLGSLLTGE